MPSGHTETATINQRRRLTDNMLRWLGELNSRPGLFLAPQSGKNALRALHNRGYARVDDGGTYHITDAGREALASQE